MDEKTKFTEQEAPLKNTDQAFVQVNKDGSSAPAATPPDNEDKDRNDVPAPGMKDR